MSEEFGRDPLYDLTLGMVASGVEVAFYAMVAVVAFGLVAAAVVLAIVGYEKLVGERAFGWTVVAVKAVGWLWFLGFVGTCCYRLE